MPPSQHLNIGLVMNAWALYRAYPWRWLGASLLACSLQLGLWIALRLAFPLPDDSPWWQQYLRAVMMGMLLLGVHHFFKAGLCRMTLDQLNGEPVRLRRLFAPVAGLGVTVLTSLVAGSVIQLGYGMAFIPGLILEGLFLLVCPILADRKLTLTKTLQLSIKTLQPELIYAMLFVLSLSLLSGLAGSSFWPVHLLIQVLIYPFVPQVQALLYRSYFSYRSFEYRP
jgi:hypothetical protein